MSERLRSIVDRLGIQPADRVLEIGCGHGAAAMAVRVGLLNRRPERARAPWSRGWCPAGRSTRPSTRRGVEPDIRHTDA